jgi:hypothetical protein
MLGPSWVFALPSAVLGGAALIVLMLAGVALLYPGRVSFFGNYWVILAGAMLGVSHVAGLLSAASHLYGVREGYRQPSAWTNRLARWVSLETMLLVGLILAVMGIVLLFIVVGYWSSNQFHPITTALPAVLGTCLIVVGTQNVLGGFLLAILGGNRAEFLQDLAGRPSPSQRLDLLSSVPLGGEARPQA